MDTSYVMFGACSKAQVEYGDRTGGRTSTIAEFLYQYLGTVLIVGGCSPELTGHAKLTAYARTPILPRE